MKNSFEVPEIEIMRTGPEDVITTSYAHGERNSFIYNETPDW